MAPSIARSIASAARPSGLESWATTVNTQSTPPVTEA